MDFTIHICPQVVLVGCETEKSYSNRTKQLLHLGAGKTPITILWRLKLWISRDNLWISRLRCGQVREWREMSASSDPQIWAGFWSPSKMWIRQKTTFPVDKYVHKFLRFSPQEEGCSLTKKAQHPV